jgi:hypothetical protein
MWSRWLWLTVTMSSGGSASYASPGGALRGMTASRDESTGSVRIERPPSCKRKVACPTQVSDGTGAPRSATPSFGTIGTGAVGGVTRLGSGPSPSFHRITSRKPRKCVV